jgi:hypothetical protein
LGGEHVVAVLHRVFHAPFGDARPEWFGVGKKAYNPKRLVAS